MQIYGIGVDSTTISRIEKSMARPGFLEKCFGAEEQTLFLHSRPETVAANFAAKEALSKAFGTGLFGFVFSEVQVLRKEGVLLTPHLTLAQKINYLASMTTYFDGWQKAIFWLAPVVVLLTGWMPI
ncbi:MAG: 4'-phosphopantetheinyl transferase superfamily protein, partial [Ruthenibacterium sp.]